MQLSISAEYRCTEHPQLNVRTMHSHDCYELWYLLAGDADYRVEGSRYHLMPGDIMLMRKGEVHMFQLRSAARYERMFVYFELSELLELTGASSLLSIFNDRPLGKYNHYPAALFPDNRWVDYLRKICQTEDPRKQLCYLLPLLSDLADGFDTVRSIPAFGEKDRAASIISYINANLHRDLSLDVLTERFYISKTHLNRVFRQATGTTVWEYITIKRLFLAKALMDAGGQPTDIYQQCGFKDYTTFFRSYKQHFGVSPRTHASKADTDP